MILVPLENNLDLILEFLNYSYEDYEDKDYSGLQKRFKEKLQEQDIIQENKQGQIVLTSSLRLSCEKLSQVKSENKVFLEQLISSYNKTGNNSLNIESLSPAELAAIPLKSLDEVPTNLMQYTKPLRTKRTNLTFKVTEEEASILESVSLEQKLETNVLHSATTSFNNVHFEPKKLLSRRNMKEYFILRTDLGLLVSKLTEGKKQTCKMPLKLNVEQIDDLDVLFVTLYNALNENSYDESKDVDYLDCNQGEVLKQLYNDILICLKARMKNSDISGNSVFVPESEEVLKRFSEVVKNHIDTEIKEEAGLRIKMLKMLEISDSENSFNKKRQELATYVFSKNEISLLGEESIKVLFKTIDECFDQVLSQANKTDIPLSEAKKISQSEFMPFLFKASERLKFIEDLEISTDDFEHFISWRLSAHEVAEIKRLGIEIYRKERNVSEHGMAEKTVGALNAILCEIKPGCERFAEVVVSKFLPAVFKIVVPQHLADIVSSETFKSLLEDNNWKPSFINDSHKGKGNGPGPNK